MRLASALGRDGLPRTAELVILLSVVIVALCLRVTYLHMAGRWHAPPEYDGIEYDMLATHLVRGQGFVLKEGQPYGFRPPGFAFFLAAVYAVFGRSYLAIRASNALLGALTCLPIYFFTKQVWRWQTGVVASLAVAAHPLLIYLTGMIYPECLMLFLLAVLLLQTNRALRSHRISQIAPLGLLLGCLIYLRPSWVVFGVALGAWTWFSWATLKERFIASAILTVVTALVIVPWTVRNFMAFDAFVWMATEGGVTLWSSNNPLAKGGCTEPSPATWLGPDPPTDLRGWPGLTETESEARFRAAAVNWIQRHPAEFLRLLPKKLVRAWGLNFGNEARPVNLPAVVPVIYSFFLITCLVGFVLSLRRWRESMVLYLTIIVSSLNALIFYGGTRQSASLVLPLVIFAALACHRALLAILRQTLPAQESVVA